jgi:iron complex outermembrane receptor protein
MRKIFAVLMMFTACLALSIGPAFAQEAPQIYEDNETYEAPLSQETPREIYEGEDVPYGETPQNNETPQDNLTYDETSSQEMPQDNETFSQETLSQEAPQIYGDNETYGASDDVIWLEEVEVSERKETTEYITQEQMELKGTSNLWEIMGSLPGITLTGGTQRNESNFILRGFNAARVPVYIDGVPQAVPYRGEADHGRILTYDVESIEVQKGYSSMMMGSNNLGGLVNLTIAKPKKEVELTIKYSSGFDSIFSHQEHLSVLSAGTRQEYFYAKATVAQLDQSHFRLSNSFTPQNEYQTSVRRNDSRVDDLKMTFIAGITPVPELDTYLTYVMQRADKQAPGDVAAFEPRIWDWPKWDRDTVSLNAAYTADSYYAKFLGYYDSYRNRLYTERPHSIPSDYDDYAAGFKLEGGYDFNKSNRLGMSALWKTDVHRGYDNVTDYYAKESAIEEFTYSFGAEYTLLPVNSIPLTVVFGLGYDVLEPQTYWTVYKGKHGLGAGDTLDALTYQVGLFYDLTKEHEFHITFARKAHFPTMTERFSTRFDTVIPNPDLKPEYALHYEAGYRGVIPGKARFTAAAYFSDFVDKIFQESVRDVATGQTVSHSLNKDKWIYYGLEFSMEYFINDYISYGLAASYNRSESRYEDVREANHPDYTGNMFASFMPFENISIVPQAEYTSYRYVSADYASRERMDEYLLLHCKARWEKILNHFYIELAVHNITDEDYEIRRYFPMPGRVYTLTVGGML